MEFTYQPAFLCQVEQAEGNNARFTLSHRRLDKSFLFFLACRKKQSKPRHKKNPGKRMLTN